MKKTSSLLVILNVDFIAVNNMINYLPWPVLKKLGTFVFPSSIRSLRSRFSAPDLQFKVFELWRGCYIFLFIRLAHLQRKSNYLTYHIYIQVTRDSTSVSGTDWREIINNSSVIWIQTRKLHLTHADRLSMWAVSCL